MPVGGKYFIYSENREQHLGAYTSFNNKGNQSIPEGFATELIYSDTIVLEYYEPSAVTKQAIISIEGIVHGYKNNIRDILNGGTKAAGYNASGPCQVNVNCPEGAEWQNEKRAVARIVNGNTCCSGFLVNNTSMDYTPYFLTADHCLHSWEDVTLNTDLNQYFFFWNYESSSCDLGRLESEPPHFTTSGAVLISNTDYYGNNSPRHTDFALLRLKEDPKNHSNIQPYYLGWDRSGRTEQAGGVVIHHPMGDVKKIAHTDVLYNYAAEPVYWRSEFIPTNNGFSVIEKGSSGSPLLNRDHHLIGHLSQGNAGNHCADNPETTESFLENLIHHGQELITQNED